MLVESNNTTINQLIFTETFVTAYLTSERGTFIMNYTYKIQEDNLFFKPKFNAINIQPNRQPFNNSPTFNDTRPTFNQTWFINITMS